MTASEPFSHRIRVRYAEVDGQGVVFNAHWLTYFDETCTRFVGAWGFGPGFWIDQFDVMLVKAVLEWTGPARFDEWIDITVVPTRLGTKSFDLRYEAAVDAKPVCRAVITYVAVKPGTNESMELPDPVRSVLTDRVMPSARSADRPAPTDGCEATCRDRTRWPAG